MTRRIADLDSLRGLAIIMVLLFHAHSIGVAWPVPAWDHLTLNYIEFWPGVDLFFAVSGFIIARALLPQLAAAETPAAFLRVALAFWTRRAWRLLPAAWLWLAITLALSVVFRGRGDFGDVHTNFEATIAGMLALANFRFAASFWQWDYGASSQYWSLSLEEQFYLLLPPLAFLLRRRLAIAIALLAALFFCLPPLPWVGTLRLHAILLGVLVAILSATPAWALTAPSFLRGPAWRRWLTLGICLLGITAVAPIKQRVTALPFDVIGVLCGALVLIAGHDRGFLSLGRAVDRLLHWFAARAYSLYLCHVAILLANRIVWQAMLPGGFDHRPAAKLAFLLTDWLLVFAAAELTLRLVETPLRRRGAVIVQAMLAADHT